MRKLSYAFILAVGFLPAICLTSCDNNNNSSSQATAKSGCEQAEESDTMKNVHIDRTGVKSDRTGVNDVVVQMYGDLDKLNPVTSTSADAGYVEGRIYTQLLDVDPDSFTVFPYLCVARPTIKLINEGEYKGGMSMTWELRPEATWDNGSPVTAADVVFTMKAVKNPQVDDEQLRPYLDFVDDIIVDPTNPRKFTYMCKGRYFASEFAAGLFAVLPEYVFDPQHIMRKFTVKDLNDPAKVSHLKSNPDIIKFANLFNSDKCSRGKDFIVGNGPYEFDQWITGQRVIVKRKKNWWGDKLKGVNRDFEAYPDKVTYEVITDVNAATAALKGEKLDVLSGIKAKDFIEISHDRRMMEKYNFYKPNQLAYSYMGLNMRSPKLNDKRVRRALAYCVDVDKIIEKLS
ncbi:MAG TPA: ABC transporter substrate-binding protein, partial [Chitinophagales bacterium]|nr:ABC transporter substrate-binding protein [Chitinophagales bacterium]